MKKRILAIVLLAVMGLTACSPKDGMPTDNVYHPETDYPLMYEANLNGIQVAETEKGYYFINGWFLFYADKETMKAVPVCNKPNCKHHEETDPFQVVTCNACLGAGCSLPYIQYYEGAVYTIQGFDPETHSQDKYLVRISADGSERKQLMQVSESDLVALHRGYVYIVQEGTNANVSRVPLKDLKAEPEIVFESRLDDSGFYMQLKGNYLLMQDSGVKKQDKSFCAQNFSCNLLTKETVHILEDEEEKGFEISGLKTNDDRFLYRKFHTESDPDDKITDPNILYTADINGKNEKIFQDFQDHTDQFYTHLTYDGTFYYEEWRNFSLEDEEQKNRELRMYDKDFNMLYCGKMDWLPMHYWLTYATGPYMFFSYTDHNTGEDVLEAVDKTQLSQGKLERIRIFDQEYYPPMAWES